MIYHDGSAVEEEFDYSQLKLQSDVVTKNIFEPILLNLVDQSFSENVMGFGISFKYKEELAR